MNKKLKIHKWNRQDFIIKYMFKYSTVFQE